MDELFIIAEKEMMKLKQPYVGTEHLFLAYLKKYENKHITYDKFKRYILEIIGSSYKKSEYVLYTPILRKIKNDGKDIKSAMQSILGDSDSIVYNILLSKRENIEEIYNDIVNTIN